MSLSETKTPKVTHIYARDPHDFYIEPEWCSRRLFDVENFDGLILDPACGTGRIVQAAINSGHKAYGTYIVDRGCLGSDQHRVDYLSEALLVANIVSNPPFGAAEKFVRKALQEAGRKVAMLLPATWHLGDKRARWLATTPLQKILFMTPRPSMPPGKSILSGLKPGSGTKDFAWFVWHQGYCGKPEVDWLHRDHDPKFISLGDAAASVVEKLAQRRAK